MKLQATTTKKTCGKAESHTHLEHQLLKLFQVFSGYKEEKNPPGQSFSLQMMVTLILILPAPYAAAFVLLLCQLDCDGLFTA